MSSPWEAKPPTGAERQQTAQDSILHAEAIVDGQVIREGSADTPTLVYVLRNFKGKEQFVVEINTSIPCSADLRLGQRKRMFLNFQSDYYFLDVDYPDNSQAEDQILGTSRTNAFQAGAVIDYIALPFRIILLGYPLAFLLVSAISAPIIWAILKNRGKRITN